MRTILGMPAPSPLSIAVLGPPRIEVDGRPLAVDTRKAVALLAYVAVEGETTRETLAALLWSRSDTTKARAVLRRTLSTLRGALGDGRLATDRDLVWLEPAGVSLDLAELRTLIGECRDHGHGPESTCARCVPPLRRAAELARGPLLEGFGLADSPAFDDWLQAAGAESRREVAAILDRLARALVGTGDHPGAAAVARRQLGLDPLHEPSHRILIAAYAAAGERQAALEQYRACVRILDRELGVRPLDETTELYHAVLEGHRQVRPTSDQQSTPANAGHALVAREREQSALARSLAALGPDGRVVGIVGEAGIGKSRVVDELIGRARGEGRPTILVRCFAEERDLAYGAATALARGAVAACVDLPDAWWISEVARLAPELGDPPAEPLDRPGARTRFLEGLAELLWHVFAGTHPGVVAVDDAHWADEGSRAAISYVAHRLAGHPVLVTLAWRGDEFVGDDPVRRLVGDAVRARRGLMLQPGRLTVADVEALALAAGFDAATAARLFAETGGLPAFVVEYLDALGGGEPFDAVPSGVQDLLLARLASATDLARQVAGTAAVLGGVVDADMLRDTSGRSDDEIVLAIEELVARGVIAEATDRGYAFRHPQTPVLVYDRLSRARRRLLHRRAAASLADQPDATVARHLELGGDEASAARRYRAAGDRARSLYANAEARTHYESALALGDPDVAGVNAALGDLDTLTGDYPAALARYEAAAAHADADERAPIEHRIARLHLRRGELELADARLVTAIARLGDRERSHALADRSLVARRAGDADAARTFATNALELARATADDRALAQAESLVGLLLAEAGDPVEGREALARALEHARRAGDSAAEVAALNNLALVLGRAGAVGAALPLVDEALGLCGRVGDRHHEAALRNNRADLLHVSGDIAESMAELKRAVALFAEIGDPGELEPGIWKLSEW